MIYPHDLKTLVIEPTLKHLDLYSESAVNLLLMTYAAESNIAGQTRLQQVGGPALGIYQIEPATHNDVYDNFLQYRDRLQESVLELVPLTQGKLDDELAGNLNYSTAIARIIYYRDPEPLPDANDIDGLAEYYKRVFNTVKGKATVAKAKQAYQELIA